MNWPDERYVRLYVRDTVDWLGLSFVAQGLFCLLLRKVDRAGVLQLGKTGRRAVAVIIGHAGDWSRLEPALEELLADGCVEIHGEALVVPNFIAAQEAASSDKLRQQECRARARDMARSGAFVTKRDATSQNVTVCHETGQNVTTGHTASQAVTPSCAVPSVPCREREAAQEGEALLLSPPEPLKATDRQHRIFFEALTEELEAARPGATVDRTKDPAAVKRLLGMAKGDVAEARRRFRAALAAPPPFRCDTIAQLASARIWNHFAPGAGTDQPQAKLRPLAAPGAR